MGYQDRSKIVASEYEIYLAKRTDIRTAVGLPIQSVITAGGDATWIPVGAYKQGSAKFDSDAMSAKLQGGQLQQFGVNGKLEISAVQTDEAKLTALELLVNEAVDVLCVEQNSFKYIRYNAMGISVKAKDALSINDANMFILNGENMAQKVSDLKDQGTLAAS